MKKEEILAICIAEIQSGKSTIADCVKRYPELGKELTSLLEIAAGLKPDEAAPSPEFKQRAKRYLFEKMQYAPPKVSHGLSFWPKQTPARVLAFVLAVLVVFGAAGGSTVYAAQSSLPGDTLYVVKTGVENFQMAVTTDASAKADLHLKLAQRRIDEAVQQVKLNRDINVQALETVKQQFDSAIKELSNSDDTEATDNTLSQLSAATLNQQLQLEQVIANAPQSSQPVLQQALAETRRGNMIAQVAYANHDFLQRQPSVADKKLDIGQFHIEGTLLSIQDRTWNVGGTIIENVYFSGKTPAIGSRVKLEGMVKDNEAFITRINVSESSIEPTKVEGQFGGTSQDGKANIGGLSVEIGNNGNNGSNGNNGNTQLKPGDKVQLQGRTDNGKLKVTGKESQNQETGDSTTLNGVLTAVDTDGNTITVKMAGNQITVNISEARIESKNKSDRTPGLSDLKHLIGRDVRLDGLYKKNNLLYARQVRVDIGEQ